MFAKFENRKSRVVEVDGWGGAKVRGGGVVTFGETAAYVVLQEFGIRQAEMANRAELAEMRRNTDGKIIRVDPDYFC